MVALRERLLSPPRDLTTWMDAACIAVTVWLVVATLAGVIGPVRWVAALFFMTFVPGWAILGHVRLGEGFTRVALSVPLSLTVAGGAATILLWVEAWRPHVLFYVLATLSLGALLVSVLRGSREAE